MKSLILLVPLFSTSLLHAASVQIGDLRLPATTYGADTYFDPASPGDTTLAVSGAPVAVNGNFLVASQNSDGGAPNTGEDPALRTFSSVTQTRNLNRFTASSAASGGVRRVGAAQWELGLTSIDGYLSTNSLALTALDLRLATAVSDSTKQYDVYLSYTNASESIALASLSTAVTAGADNFSNFWFPAQSSSEGSIVNGTHKLIELGHTGALDTTIDLLPLYNAGARDFNLIISSGDFLSNRTIDILDGSGLSIDTISVPEPSTSVLALITAFGLLRRRR